MFGFIPHNEAKQIVYYGSSFSGNADGWRTFSKPSGINYVAFTIIGGGGGGGRTTNSATGAGAGGGGSGGITNILLPAFILPDSIFINVGAGGPGSVASGTAGTNGGSSYVCVYPSTSVGWILGYANGGNGGTNTTTAGTGATVAAISAMPFATGYHYALYAGLSGTLGGAATGGTNLTLGNLCLSGGAGGGGYSSGVGGNITGAGLIPTISGGAAAQPGDSGVWFWKGFKGCGGAGGGGSASAGGKGGDGSFGCGGGGGGGGTTSGNGGNGGQGLVVVHYW